MAFVDASTSRKVVQGILPCKITLAGAVSAGDPVMYDSGWKLAANVNTKPAILFAGEDGAIGDVITAYAMAIVECTHTLGNVPTMGEQIAVSDAGIYEPDAATDQDVGYVVEIDADSLHSRILVGGMVEIDCLGAA